MSGDRPFPDNALVPGMYRRDTKMMVVGGGGRGKTTFIRQQAACLSQGIFPIPAATESWRIEPLRVLHVDLEHSEETNAEEYGALRQRVRQVAGVDYDSDRLRLWERPEGLNFQNHQHLALLKAAVRHADPDLLCIGPLYRFGADLPELEAAALMGRVLDEIRVRQRCMVLIEAHPPHGEERPFGSSFWEWWVTRGRALVPTDDEAMYDLRAWRGDRHPTNLPRRLRHGNQWPWEAA